MLGGTFECKQNLAKPLGAWWGSATSKKPSEAYRKLIDACRLAVEQAYTREGDAIGSYAEAAGDEGAAEAFFEAFMKSAMGANLLPPWWDDAHTAGCRKLAQNPRGGFYLLHAIERSDAQQTWGAEVLILLALADHVYTSMDGIDLDDEDDYDSTEDSESEGERDLPVNPVRAAHINTPAAAASPSEAVLLRECLVCKVALPKSEYSKTQWSKGGKGEKVGQRRCKGCMESDALAGGA